MKKIIFIVFALMFACNIAFAATSSGHLFIPVSDPSVFGSVPTDAQVFSFDLSSSSLLTNPTYISTHDPFGDSQSTKSNAVADNKGNVYFYFGGASTSGGENLIHGFNSLKGESSMTTFSPIYTNNGRVESFNPESPIELAYYKDQLYLLGTDHQDNPHIWIYSQADFQLNGQFQHPKAVQELKLQTPEGANPKYINAITIDSSGQIYLAFANKTDDGGDIIAKYAPGQEQASTLYYLPSQQNQYVSHIAIYDDQVYVTTFVYDCSRIYKLIPGEIAKQINLPNLADISQIDDISFDGLGNTFVIYCNNDFLVEVDMYIGVPVDGKTPIATYAIPGYPKKPSNATSLVWSQK
ncbi:MAG: hypothetical protein KKA99_01850 [Gammaproteobacteria bacterium]|nr:hypothetical protein [Gammaproteobacteria bacterium]MBU1559058.1 hypothetical protein [Gammaproteobacteria bacterium]MBU2546110.1 hypothetical protein [Gammaproteobacteria bacterium]